MVVFSTGLALLIPHRLRLYTTSLCVRRFVPEDAGALFVLSNEDAFRTWLPSQVYEDVVQARSAVESLITKYSTPANPRHDAYVLGIEHRTDRALIGHVGFSPFGDDVEIGFSVAQRYQRRGLATEAVAAASRWALEAFTLDRILGIASAANNPSKSTLVRAQFVHQEDCRMTFQGTEQMVSIYVLLRDRCGGNAKRVC